MRKSFLVGLVALAVATAAPAISAESSSSDLLKKAVETIQSRIKYLKETHEALPKRGVLEMHFGLEISSPKLSKDVEIGIDTKWTVANREQFKVEVKSDSVSGTFYRNGQTAVFHVPAMNAYTEIEIPKELEEAFKKQLRAKLEKRKQKCQAKVKKLKGSLDAGAGELLQRIAGKTVDGQTASVLQVKKDTGTLTLTLRDEDGLPLSAEGEGAKKSGALAFGYTKDGYLSRLEGEGTFDTPKGEATFDLVADLERDAKHLVKEFDIGLDLSREKGSVEIELSGTIDRSAEVTEKDVRFTAPEGAEKISKRRMKMKIFRKVADRFFDLVEAFHAEDSQ